MLGHTLATTLNNSSETKTLPREIINSIETDTIIRFMFTLADGRLVTAHEFGAIKIWNFIEPKELKCQEIIALKDVLHTKETENIQIQSLHASSDNHIYALCSVSQENQYKICIAKLHDKHECFWIDCPQDRYQSYFSTMLLDEWLVISGWWYTEQRLLLVNLNNGECVSKETNSRLLLLGSIVTDDFLICTDEINSELAFISIKNLLSSEPLKVDTTHHFKTDHLISFLLDNKNICFYSTEGNFKALNLDSMTMISIEIPFFLTWYLSLINNDDDHILLHHIKYPSDAFEIWNLTTKQIVETIFTCQAQHRTYECHMLLPNGKIIHSYLDTDKNKSCLNILESKHIKQNDQQIENALSPFLLPDLNNITRSYIGTFFQYKKPKQMSVATEAVMSVRTATPSNLH